MADVPSWALPSVNAAKGVTAPIVQKSTAQIRQETAGAEHNEAELPYVAPKAKTELEKGSQSIQFTPLEQSRNEMSNFNGLKPVQEYTLSLPMLDAALKSGTTAADDSDLIMLAAKLQDPTGSVREGDEARYNNIQAALDRIPQEFKRQFLKEGRFTDQARADIRQYLIRRVASYRQAYNTERNRFTDRVVRSNERGGVKIDPLDVVGPDPGHTFFSAFKQYDDKMTAAAGKKEPNTTGIFDALPEGAQIGGEKLKGFRFSPDSEAKITDYVRNSPDFTPEGYAHLVTGLAISEGKLKPEEADKTYAGMLPAAQEYFKDATPESRAKVPPGLDYSKTDEAHQKEAGLLESAGQAMRNVPESVVQLGEGLTALPIDAVKSVINRTREGTIKSIPDLAVEMVKSMGGDPAGPTTKALGDALMARYGSWDAVKNTAITDPLGLMGDASMVLTAGGSALAKAPGIIGRTGETVATLGKMADPISGLVGLGEKATNLGTRAASAIPEGVTELGAKSVAGAAGLPSGIGGPALREAAGAGFERGRTGAVTPRSEAFTENMRNPEANVGDAVTMARDAVGNLREQASAQYRAQMAQFGQNPVPLDINVVRQRMAAIKPKSYDAWVDKTHRPADHIAWEKMNNAVEGYAGEAMQNPALLEPLAMDQFKQDLYDIGSKTGGAFDKDAARIARTAYNGVKDELIRHDPVYATTMKNYEKAAKEAQQLDETFGLAAARGKEPNIDRATRRLQSIMRNNAYTNYGQRAGQGERLAELDPTGTLLASLAGQTASAIPPRGLQGITGVGAGIAGYATNPVSLLAAPLFSPRGMGELTYGLGRAAGTGARVVDAAAPYADKLYDLYSKYAPETLAATQLGSLTGEGIEAQQQPEEDQAPPSLDLPTITEQLRQRYALGGPVHLDMLHRLAARYG